MHHYMLSKELTFIKGEIMEIFLDTANIDEIKEVAKLELDGVTTNPSLIAKEGRDLYRPFMKFVRLSHDRSLQKRYHKPQKEWFVKEDYCSNP